MFRALMVLASLAIVTHAFALGARSELRDALADAIGRYPALAASVHPTDYRTLDDRIAARELLNRTTMASLGQTFTDDYRESAEEILSHGAVRIDGTQPDLAPVRDAFLRCLARMGLSEDRCRLYMFGSLEVEVFSWGLPPERGDSLVGISSRVVRLYLDGDEGLKMSDAELEFLFHRELAHLQASHGIFQMLTLFAHSVEDKLNQEARNMLHRLYRSAGLGGFVLSLADGLTSPIQKFLVSLAFRRYYVWDINAVVSANRAALLAVAAARSPQESLEAGTRTLLLAMLQDYRMVRRVDVSAFLAQVQAQTDLAGLVRNPDRLGVDREALAPVGTDGVSVTGLWDKILEILKNLIGMHNPSFPVKTAGYVEMVSDLARWRKTREFADMQAGIASPDLIERGLLVLRRISDLDDLAHIREFQLAPQAGHDDQVLRQVKQRLADALAAELANDLAAHGGQLEGSRLGALSDGLLQLSYQYQVSAHRVVELIAKRPDLTPATRGALEHALLESRFDNLLETALYHDDLVVYLKSIQAPVQIYLDYTGYFEKRETELVDATAARLADPVEQVTLIDWLAHHHDTTRPAPQKKAFQSVCTALVAKLEAAGQPAMAEAVRQFALAHP